MKKLPSVTWALLTTVIALSSFPRTSTRLRTETDMGAESVSELSATLFAASGAKILFRPENGRLPDVRESLPDSEVPHLVLRRNGALTPPEERTLMLTVTGIKVPPSGATVTLYVETQHGDPDVPEGAEAEPVDATVLGAGTRIPVWREDRRIANTMGVTQTHTTVLTHTFQGTVVWNGERIPTPTDYFRYEVTVTPGNHTGNTGRPGRDGSQSGYLHASADYAFLMEGQYVAELPEVPEATDGAAPDELVVYFLDMIPFGKDAVDPDTWLARKDVPSYVGSELVPRMVEAFRVQSEDWGFPWYAAWTSFRAEEGPERLSVALTDGRTYFHGRAPRRGDAGITIKVWGGNVQHETLTEGLMSNFRHELFHNLQRNINQYNGGDGNVDGADNAWQFFSEGTAVLASSVGPMDQQAGWDAQAYLLHANPFIGYSVRFTDLNRSYEQIIPYRAATYWRFLYEQCGRVEDGNLDPSAGMGVIRSVLTILYSGDVVDVSTSTGLVEALPEIMDRALAGSPCPFETHAESLTAFARAIYSLQVEGGRCTSPGSPAGCGFYDPQDLYSEPPIGEVTYSEAIEGYSGEIPSSFGVDLLDVTLDPSAHGRPLTLEFQSAPEGNAEYSVQVWELQSSGPDTGPRRLSNLGGGPRTLEGTGSDGELSIVIPASERTGSNRLGLIITRVDAFERRDPVGAYTILLRPVPSQGKASGG